MQSVTSNAVYRAFEDKSDVYTLVGKKELTTTDVTSTLILSRKFSDYKLIIINLYAGTNGNVIVGGHSIPRVYFTKQTMQIGFVSSDSVENAVIINTISDTQVNLKARFSDTSYKYVEILGIK
jgi:hypothetical protein